MKTSIEIISDFDLIVKELFGIYLDTLMGFQLTLNGVENTRNNLASEKGETIEQINRYSFRHTTFFSERIHEETLGDFIIRMSKDGRNTTFAANMCIISIFHYWEDHYRKAIADALNISKEDLKTDIIGDIRLLRNSIVHHNAIALKEIEKCKILNLFKEHDIIKLSREDILYIINGVKNYTAKLKSDASKSISISEFVHYEIAITLAKNKDDKELAKYHFEEAIRINKSFVDAYMDYANLLFEKFNDPKSAEECYKVAISLNPQHMLTRANYAVFLAMCNRVEESQKNFLMALEIDSFHVTANYNYALILIRNLKEFEKAKHHLEIALQTEPLNYEILLQYASLLRQNFNDYSNAELYYKKIFELNIDYPAGYNDYGLLLMENKGEFASAEKAFLKAIELNKDFAEAYYNYGNLLFFYSAQTIENWRLAKECYLKAIAINANYVEAFMNLAILCAYSLKEIEEGVIYMKSAIIIDSKNDQLYNNLASIYKDIIGDVVEANKLYQCAIELNPKNSLAHFGFAQLLRYNLGDILNAKNHYLKAISLDNSLRNIQMETDLGV